ncbi:MAG: SDR family oxidoreductase [Candidatus Magasanikbacteria bacterium]|nr:SDR family oxidoreductase [Candidatus Magasanikbacteria bacterium]
MRILVTGGAGFVGSHLIDRLLAEGHSVICVDSFFSGKKENIAHHIDNPNFTLVAHDIRFPLKLKSERLDRIYHLACPASPMQYQFDPILTLETSIIGTKHMLNLARQTGARLLFSSTSEVYGDPLEHPQKENYFGNVDPLGKRACYDEGKRAAETLCKDFIEQHKVDARIVRLFNVYGPRMMFNDGRVLSNFILQALLGEDMTVYGKGEQTRSFMYIDDLIDALIKRMEVLGDDWRPVNLGNPDERAIIDLANQVKVATNSQSAIVHYDDNDMPGRIGDPRRRCPDISRAKELLNWSPKVSFAEGLQKTIADFRIRLEHRPHVLVFSTSYAPVSGPAENAAAEVIARSPGYEFDIITARLNSDMPAESHEGRVHIYRVGTGRKFDKFLLPIRASIKAKKLHKKNHYQIAWAIMASYGALAAIIFSSVLRAKVPFLLSVFEGNIENRMLQRGRLLSPLYQLIFRHAHRWQVVGQMSERQRSWLEDERHVQAIQADGNWELLAKRTKEQFQEIEILSTRLS